MTYGDQLDRPIEKLGFYADLAEEYPYRTPIGAVGEDGSGNGGTAGPGNGGSAGKGGVPPDVLERAEVIMHYQAKNTTPTNSSAVEMSLYFQNASDDALPLDAVEVFDRFLERIRVAGSETPS